MNYLEPEDLERELLKSQQQDNVPTAELCSMFLLMIERFMRSPKYNGWPQEVKEDISSIVLIKCIKSIKNYKRKLDDKKSNCFSYFTRAIETTIWTAIAKIKKHDNMIDKLRQEQLDKLKSLGFSKQNYDG